jgi:hypothetical protein
MKKNKRIDKLTLKLTADRVITGKASKDQEEFMKRRLEAMYNSDNDLFIRDEDILEEKDDSLQEKSIPDDTL